MANGLYIWLYSGANIHSRRRQFWTWGELGITEEAWDAMSDEQHEAFARDIAFDQSDWGFTKADEMPSGIC